MTSSTPEEAAGLETRGTVRRPGFARPLSWSDLSPFEQGYIRALFDSCRCDPPTGLLGFSDLSPAALAMAIRDCEKLVTFAREVCAVDYVRSPSDGGWFWNARQRGEWREQGFPPLLITLTETGLVQTQERG